MFLVVFYTKTAIIKEEKTSHFSMKKVFLFVDLRGDLVYDYRALKVSRKQKTTSHLLPEGKGKRYILIWKKC